MTETEASRLSDHLQHDHPAEPMPKHKPFKFFCYFCGANEHEIRLVCGPAGVAICSNCIARAAAELARTSKETCPINLVEDDK